VEANQIWAVIPAIGAAASFGGAGLLQHRASRQAPPSGPLRPQLLFDLIRIPAFRWGVVLGALGFALQVTALSFGPLGLVQPILAMGVLFYLGIASAMMRQAPDWRLVGAALLTTLGISGFLVAARPADGTGHISGSVWPLAVAFAAVVVVCLILSTRVAHRFRALPLSIAAAVCYGVTASLVRSLVSTLDPATLLGQWQLYAVIVLGPAGFLLNQNAFQEGRVGSVAVAIITVGDPVVSIIAGAIWLGESLTAGPGLVAAQVISLLVMTGGITLLAHRAQTVGERIRGGQDEQSDTPEVQ
jgi:drug/metabolite transporter (DMT)-like permease